MAGERRSEWNCRNQLGKLVRQTNSFPFECCSDFTGDQRTSCPSIASPKECYDGKWLDFLSLRVDAEVQKECVRIGQHVSVESLMGTEHNPLPVPHLHERSQNRHIRTGVDSDRETQVPKHGNLYWQIPILVVSTNSSVEAPMSRLNFQSTFTKFICSRHKCPAAIVAVDLNAIQTKCVTFKPCCVFTNSL